MLPPTSGCVAEPNARRSPVYRDAPAEGFGLVVNQGKGALGMELLERGLRPQR